MDTINMQSNKNISLSLIAEYGGSESDSDDHDNKSNNTSNEDRDSPVLSEMVLKNNIINACAHGPLARPLDEDSSSHIIIDNTGDGVSQYQVTEYRDVEIESSSSDDSDIDSVKEVEEVLSGDDEAPEKRQPAKVPGELGLDDLPPIQDLAISLPPQVTITKIGTVASVVDKLVVVKGFPNSPAVDLDSVLFLENGSKVLGRVFDVFGPVTEPHYAVRFNSRQHVEERGVSVGQEVCVAPDTEHTTYVFLHELMKTKGSDASWMNDVEPPPNHIDYSDDEAERAAKKEHKQSKEPPATKPNTKRPAVKAKKKWNRHDNNAPPNRNPSSEEEMRNPFLNFSRLPPWQVPYDMPNFSRPPPPFLSGYGSRMVPPMMDNFQFGSSAYMRGPVPVHPRSTTPPNPWTVFGSNYNNAGWPQTQWPNNQMPPPGN